MAVRKIKEPKSIEEAREILIAVIGNGRRLYISAHWHDSIHDGQARSSVGFQCDVGPAEGYLTTEIEARGATPGELVRNVLKAHEELCRERARETARQNDGTPRLGKAKPQTSMFG
jgi:hypothetical protein